MSLRTKSLKTVLATAILTIACVMQSATVKAAGGIFSLSPMYQLVTLNPGETYTGNFKITNPANAAADFEYELRVEPFSADGNNSYSLTANGDYNQMVDWITLPYNEGLVSPNSSQEVRFTIDVPDDAAAGGQYASIVVRSKAASKTDTNIDLQEIYESAHLIYADITGETVRKGEINNISVPGFLFSGDIFGSVEIKNIGNVHSEATQTLQVFPLFSSEEVYTNEENPDTVFIMPGNTRYGSVSWDETPSMGIFHVIYNVEFEGVKQNIDKIVIVCPIWLLFIILLIIILIIFKILSGKKNRK